MATYEEIAPIISGAGISRSSVENYFESLPEATSPPEPPEITTNKIVAVADAYLETGIEASGGLLKIATQAKLTVSQVKSIIREIDKLKSIWEADQDDLG